MPLGLRRKQNWKEGVVELWCNHKGLSRPHVGPWTCNGPSESSHPEARRAGLYTHPTWTSQWMQAVPYWDGSRAERKAQRTTRHPSSWGESAWFLGKGPWAAHHNMKGFRGAGILNCWCFQAAHSEGVINSHCHWHVWECPAPLWNVMSGQRGIGPGSMWQGTLTYPQHWPHASVIPQWLICGSYLAKVNIWLWTWNGHLMLFPGNHTIFHEFYVLSLALLDK